jgi:hypothetical protein
VRPTRPSTGWDQAVWTNDLSRAHRVSRARKVGLCWVNCYEEGDMTMPFGGVRKSGFGRDKSLHALEKFWEPEVHLDPAGLTADPAGLTARSPGSRGRAAGAIGGWHGLAG